MMHRPFYLMTEPSHFDVRYQINPWMQPDMWMADRDGARQRAVTASAQLAKAIRAAGGDVETVGGVEGFPDLVFTANAAIVLDGVVLLAHFRHPERQGEEPVFRAAFENLERRSLVDRIVELPEGVLQEGAGDCIWDIDREIFWAGYGQRSTANSMLAIEEAFGKDVVALELASPRYYHLDTCFCPLARGRVLYYPNAFTPLSLAKIRSLVRPSDRIEASDAEAESFCVNAVNIGATIIMAKAPQSLKDKLTAKGYAVVEVDLAPFILSGGAAYCMTLRLNRRSWAEEARRITG